MEPMASTVGLDVGRIPRTCRTQMIVIALTKTNYRGPSRLHSFEGVHHPSQLVLVSFASLSYAHSACNRFLNGFACLE